MQRPEEELDLGTVTGLWRTAPGGLFHLHILEKEAEGHFGTYAEPNDHLTFDAWMLPEGAFVAVFFPEAHMLSVARDQALVDARTAKGETDESSAGDSERGTGGGPHTPAPDGSP